MTSFINPLFDQQYCYEFESYKTNQQLQLSSSLEKIVTLRNTTSDAIATDRFIELFENALSLCAQQSFRMGYRITAFAAFAGINDYADFPGDFGTALLYALHHPDAQLSTIHELMQKTLKERIDTLAKVKARRVKILQCNNTRTMDYLLSLINTFLIRSPSHWMPEKSGDDWVEFSHGGGFQSIKAFLTGDWKGYESDSLLNCFWVTPLEVKHPDRDNYYALRTPPKHFDTPCILKGKIQRKYLAQCPNAYEAKIEKENMNKICNISIHALSSNGAFSYFPAILPSLKERVSKETNQNLLKIF